MATRGGRDTLLSLFEQIDGEARYLTADDASRWRASSAKPAPHSRRVMNLGRLDSRSAKRMTLATPTESAK